MYFRGQGHVTAAGVGVKGKVFSKLYRIKTFKDYKAAASIKGKKPFSIRRKLFKPAPIINNIIGIINIK